MIESAGTIYSVPFVVFRFAVPFVMFGFAVPFVVFRFAYVIEREGLIF